MLVFLCPSDSVFMVGKGLTKHSIFKMANTKGGGGGGEFCDLPPRRVMEEL